MTRSTKHLAAVAAAGALALGGCGADEDSTEKSGQNTGQAGGTPTQPAPAPGSQTRRSGAGANLKVAADPGGKLEFDKDALQARAGKVSIDMANPSSIPHAIAIEGGGVDVRGKTVEKNGTSSVETDLKAGEYEFYCPVPGHAPVMRGKLSVK